MYSPLFICLSTFSKRLFLNRYNKNYRKLISLRNYCDESKGDPPHSGLEVRKSLGSKYKLFKEEEADIIFDVEEEKFLHKITIEKEFNEFEGLNLKRGETGVFEIEDLVEVLRRDNAQNIFVAKVPEELGYVDYIVFAGGKSKRHLLGIAEFVKKVYKKKMFLSDVVPRLEGENLSKWIAIDLGNIAVHLMLEDTREKYDLESLWSVGPAYDPKIVNKDNDKAVEDLLRRHSISLDDFQPANKLL